MEKYLRETELLDFSNPAFSRLFEERRWDDLNQEHQIKEIYNYVRDEIRFGYNASDEIVSSRVLEDNYGQCNTKAILLMSLLRKAGIPCRIHGFAIDRKLQKGAVRGIWYKMSPRSFIHSWVEIYYSNRWFNLEGVIIDKPYLDNVRERNRDEKAFCGYGIATDDLSKLQTDWDKCDTYIQKEGINADFGVYDSPDLFFKDHRQNLGIVKRLVFKYFARFLINRNVEKTRNG